MFDIGWPELLIVAIVLIVVVGPKDLPRMLRTFGKTTNKLRAMAGDFRRQFDDALKEAELDDVKSIVEDARKLDPTADIRKELNPVKKMGEQIKSGLDEAIKPGTKAGIPAGKAADDVKAPEPPVKLSDEKPVLEPAAKKTAAAAKPGAKKSTSRSKTATSKPGARKTAAGKTASAKSASKAPAKRATRKKTGAAS
ncbi:MAG: Sec-independent protein translocase protein TatB [Rhizobiaceae bacterium]